MSRAVRAFRCTSIEEARARNAEPASKSAAELGDHFLGQPLAEIARSVLLAQIAER